MLQLGACSAGAACRCAHSAAELQPRPLPTPRLRDALAEAGVRLPPPHSTGNEQLPVPFPATQHPGAWEAAAEIAASSAAAIAAEAQAASPAGLSGLPGSGAGGSGLSPPHGSEAAAGAKRDSLDGSASGGSCKRQCTGGAAGAAATAPDQTAADGEPGATGAALGEAGQRATAQQARQGSRSPASVAEASGTPPQPAAQPASAYDRLRQQLQQAEKELSTRDKALAEAKRQLQV